MRTKTLVLALGLVVLAVAASTTYVLAHRTSSSSYYGIPENRYDDEAWWNEMRTYMEQRWQDNKDDGWWQEMREHMEQRWDNIESDDSWNEMRQYMEEHWAELEDDGYRYGDYGGYDGYGGCGGCR